MTNLTKNLLIGAVAGLAASWIKSKVEAPLQELGEQVFPPSGEELSLKGADVKRQSENMPPAILAENVYENITGDYLRRHQKLEAMKYIHYMAGAGIGAMYAAVVQPTRLYKIDNGILAGTIIWGLTHGSVLPACKLQAEVDEMPKSWWVWELGSHMVFGLALEQTRKLLTGIFTWKKK